MSSGTKRNETQLQEAEGDGKQKMRKGEDQRGDVALDRPRMQRAFGNMEI